MGADTNIQFSEPQLEQMRCAEEETTKARLVSQSAHKTIRFASSLPRLMSLKLIFELLSNLSHAVLLIVLLRFARRVYRSVCCPRRVGEEALLHYRMGSLRVASVR